MTALCVAALNETGASEVQETTKTYTKKTKSIIRRVLDVSSKLLGSSKSSTAIFSILALLDELLRGQPSMVRNRFTTGSQLFTATHVIF
jgi:hypothetical protein